MSNTTVRLDAQVWDTMRGQLLSSQGIPSWLNAVLATPFDRLQSLAADIDVERKELTASYLDFLREQIRLEPRGKEWAGALQERLGSFLPHVDQQLLFLSIFQN